MKKFTSRLLAILAVFLLLALAVLGMSYFSLQQREQQTIEIAASGTGRLIQTRDAQVFVQDVGPENGPVVILLHGMGARSELWRSTIDPLASNGFRVIAFDTPPFGFSEKLHGATSYQTTKQAARVLDVLKALHIEKAVLVCHSIGCRIGVETLLQDPSIFEKAVLVAPVLGFASDPSDPHFQQNHANTFVATLLKPTRFRDAVIGVGMNPLSVSSVFRVFVYDPTCITDERVTMLRQPLFIQNMTRASGDWLQNLLVEPDHAQYTNFQNFKKLSLPILLVWGREDTTSPLWQDEVLQKVFPNAKLDIIENAGHMPYVEKSAEFNTILLGFLRRPGA